MTSVRNSALAEGSPERRRSGRDDYLDAARSLIVDVGWRRTTMADVARRAGVSRMTIYRAWPERPQLLADLLTRELTEVTARTPGFDDLDGLVQSLLDLVTRIRENEVLARLVRLDAELLLPYLIERRGRTQEALLTQVTGVLVEGQQRGVVRDGDPDRMARVLLLSAIGLLFSTATVTDEQVSLDDLDDEIHLLMKGFLR